MNEDYLLSFDVGGKAFCKQAILAWLEDVGGSNLKLLETVTGLPQKLLSPLLAELMLEKIVKLDKVIFKPVNRR